MTTFRTRFYRVMACGYYGRSSSAAEFEDLDSTLEDLRQWSFGKALIDTRVSGTGSALPVYLFDIRRHGDIWMLVLWNEVPADEGSIASVVGTATVGAASVIANAIAANSIPGFPTYFLFSLSRSVVAPLKVGDRVLGLDGLKNYLHTFLTQSSRRVAFDEDNGDAEIVGYIDDEGDVRNDAFPKFHIQLVRLGSQAGEILRRASEIRKVIRVREVETHRAVDRAYFQRVLDSIGFSAAPRSEKVRVRQEVAVSMTREQVAQLISTVQEELEPQSNDIAFVFERDPSEHWLSNAIPTADVDLPVERENGVFSANDLAVAISRRAARIFGVLG